MRKFSGLLLVLFLITALAGTLLQAQDATPEATADVGTEATADASTGIGMVTCGSDVIAMWYVAERYFGFGTLNASMTTSGMSIDTTNIDRGQFSGLFDSMASMSSEDMMGSMDQTRMDAVAGMMMDDAAMTAGMGDTSGMSMLGQTTVADEATECAALRSQLGRFFTSIAFQDLNMGTGSTDSGAEATADPNMEATAEATQAS